MEIAVIGAGNVGSTLGRAWSKRGHRVVFGVKDPKAARVRDWPDAPAATNADAARASEVVVLATPWGATEAAVRACGDLRLLEPLAMLWIRLAMKGLVKGDFAFALLRK